jgi:hypothetical protein
MIMPGLGTPAGELGADGVGFESGGCAVDGAPMSGIPPFGTGIG